LPALTMKQGEDLTKEVSKMLVQELDSDSIKKKVDKVVSDYVKKNGIDSKPEALSKKLSWSVKVALKE
jgi:hypothetical protein